jgi:hypothetical protein
MPTVTPEGCCSSSVRPTPPSGSPAEWETHKTHCHCYASAAMHMCLSSSASTSTSSLSVQKAHTCTIRAAGSFCALPHVQLLRCWSLHLLCCAVTHCPLLPCTMRKLRSQTPPSSAVLSLIAPCCIAPCNCCGHKRRCMCPHLCLHPARLPSAKGSRTPLQGPCEATPTQSTREGHRCEHLTPVTMRLCTQSTESH